MLILENISKKYNDNPVLKDITLGFRQKELVAILGPSGCGKTTLLNIIAAIEKSDQGSLYFGYSKLNYLSTKELDSYRSKDVSYIFQNFNLIKHLNVIDNIALTNRLKNQKLDQDRVNEYLKAFNLLDLAKKFPDKLSGGERQRVAIIRSLMSDAGVILADEPTGSLDTQNSHLVMQILKDLAVDKLVILVTHDEELARQYASRIIRLKDGVIESDTKPYKGKPIVNYQYLKTGLKLLNALKLSFNNLKNKKIRTYLTVFAFSVGLFSLSLVLAISSGFKKEIKLFEKESLYDYPLIISKESVNLEVAFTHEQTKYDSNVINVKPNQMLIRNEINDQLLSLVKNMNPNLAIGITYQKAIPLDFKNIAYVNPNNKYFDLQAGRYPENPNEVMLLLDEDNAIDEAVSSYLNIRKLPLNEVLNRRLYLEELELIIVGVVKSNSNYFKDSSGILYNADVFAAEITDIYFFAKDYPSKTKIKEYFSEYQIVDEASSVINITESLVDGITIVLISFSIIALLVSIIMISILSYVSVLERQKEIGLLKTLGASKNDIKKIFLAENMIIGVLASGITLELAFNVSKIINNYVENKIALKNIVNLNGSIIVIIIGLSLLLTYLAGLIPAGIASKKSITAILHSAT